MRQLSDNHWNQYRRSTGIPACTWPTPLSPWWSPRSASSDPLALFSSHDQIFCAGRGRLALSKKSFPGRRWTTGSDPPACQPGQNQDLKIRQKQKIRQNDKRHTLARSLTNVYLVQIILQGFGKASPVQFLVKDHLEFVHILVTPREGPQIAQEQPNTSPNHPSFRISLQHQVCSYNHILFMWLQMLQFEAQED